jgi:hypothetical protein
MLHRSMWNAHGEVDGSVVGMQYCATLFHISALSAYLYHKYVVEVSV